MYPIARHGDDRKSDQAISKRHNDDLISSFVEGTASKIGISDRTIERSIQCARGVKLYNVVQNVIHI